ncbi:MAG: polysaccharide deacetylase family protein [Flavobacteriaceae bacterium]|nr:polysaccharide deacetylase family protein [Flavobacteriaceae bacterium]
MKENEGGSFVISLDFELMWGVRDKRCIASYGKALEKVQKIVPETLALFENYGIHATWATVGMLFCKDKQSLLASFPKEKPSYDDHNLSPYATAEALDDSQAPYYFAPNLLEQIKQIAGQEIGTHTYSHYYCMESGQTKDQFEQDLDSAIAVAQHCQNLHTHSIVFPRNQVNTEYLQSCAKRGLVAYRGTEKSWFNSAESDGATSLWKKINRTLDCYINIGGHHTYETHEMRSDGIHNIASSRFLRPYNQKFSFFEPLKVQRIKKSMLFAARNNQLFHLWWHPHNFGNNTEKNFENLTNILQYYRYLQSKFGMQSKTMQEAANSL